MILDQLLDILEILARTAVGRKVDYKYLNIYFWIKIREHSSFRSNKNQWKGHLDLFGNDILYLRLFCIRPDHEYWKINSVWRHQCWWRKLVTKLITWWRILINMLKMSLTIRCYHYKNLSWCLSPIYFNYDTVRWQWCWWHLDGDNFSTLMTEFWYRWHLWMLVLDAYVQNT